jgi:restriction system protein
MITVTSPTDWRDLQEQVANILHQCRFKVEVEKRIESVRGTVEVDVYAEEVIQGRKYTVVCECKHWQARVPQTVVHAFRTVAADVGANVGYVITTSDFQSGALATSKLTNIKLLNWQSFQDEFEDTWYGQHFRPWSEHLCAGPYGTMGNYRVRDLPQRQQAQMEVILEEYNELTAVIKSLLQSAMYAEKLVLPLKTSRYSVGRDVTEIPEEILNAQGYRDLLYLLQERRNRLALDAHKIVPTSHRCSSFTRWDSEYIHDYVSDEEWERIVIRYIKPLRV